MKDELKTDLNFENDNLKKYINELWDSISDILSQKDLDRLEKLHPMPFDY